MIQPYSDTATSLSPSSNTPSSDMAQRSTYLSRWHNLGGEWLSDEPELESDFHRDQIDLLLRLMKWYWRARNDVYCSGNTTVSYDPEQRTNRNFRGPDIYVVFGAESRSRNSWMVWKEGGKYPDVVFELLSNSTAKTDRSTRKELYQNEWQVSNYFWLHPETKEFRGFTLVRGQYQALKPNRHGQLWSDQMEVFVGLHQEDMGFYKDEMLRFLTTTGDLILLPEEEERSLKESAQHRERIALQRAEQLATRLRQMGLNLDEF